MSTIFQVVSQVQNMQRIRRCGSCFQGYHSLIKKADISKKKKHNKRLQVLNKSLFMYKSKITRAREVSKTDREGMSQDAGRKPDELSPWKHGSAHLYLTIPFINGSHH